MIRAILFDMDGVLIDAKEWHYEALNKALGLFGIEISYYDHLNTFDGLPTKIKLQMLSEQYYLPKELHDFINDMKLMMEKSGLKQYIDLIISNEDVEKSKPNPEMYIKAMECFGVAPNECVVVEDNPKGILAGKNSGAAVLEVSSVYDVNYENLVRKIEEQNHV